MRLFVSYAHSDKRRVKAWIVENLRAAGHDVWFDERLIAGQNWQHQLYTQIEQSDALVYALSPDSVASEWCQWEVITGLTLGKKFVPVLLKPTKTPKYVSDIQYVDFQKGPKGNAVARLLGGLQAVRPEQLPPPPLNPQGIPAQAENTNRSTSIKFEGSGTGSCLLQLAILGLAIAVIIIIAAIIIVPRGSGFSPTPTQSPTVPTPATPIVVALRNLDLRSGPGASFSRIGFLALNDSLDILGISEDGLWYQVIMPDGNLAWVLASSTSVRLDGSRSVIAIILPTHTPTSTDTPTPTSTLSPTLTPSFTASATSTPTETPTLTASVTNTLTHTHTSTLTTIPVLSPTLALTSTNTAQPPSMSAFVTSPSAESPIPIATISVTAPTIQSEAGHYPCTGTIISQGTSTLFVVFRRADRPQSPIGSVTPGQEITILDKAITNGRTWYEIIYDGQSSGWIWDTYVSLSSSCPT